MAATRTHNGPHQWESGPIPLVNVAANVVVNVYVNASYNDVDLSRALLGVADVCAAPSPARSTLRRRLEHLLRRFALGHAVVIEMVS